MNEAEDEFSGESDDDGYKNDVSLEPKTFRQVKKEFSKLSSGEQEAFDQDEWNLKQLLSLDPNETYQDEDLNGPCHSGPSTEVTICRPFWATSLKHETKPHIRYSRLLKKRLPR